MDWSTDEGPTQETSVWAPMHKLQEICPPRYSFYSHFDDHQDEVNGISFGPPHWQHSVAIPTVFFNEDHVEEILFPHGQVL